MKKIGVIGIGNPLRKDDGIGIYLLDKLIKRKEEFSENIDFIDGGTGGINLLHDFSDFDTIVIVDAVNFGGKPGDFKWFQPEDVHSNKISFDFSTHDNNFLKVIQLSKNIDKKPKSFFIFGVQPEFFSIGEELSNTLQQKFNFILDKLIKKIKTIDEE